MTTTTDLTPILDLLHDVERVHPSQPEWAPVRAAMRDTGPDLAALAPVVRLLSTAPLAVAENAMFALRDAGVEAWGDGHGRDFRFDITFPDGTAFTVTPAELPLGPEQGVAAVS